MNKQVYADEPWQDIPYEEAKDIQRQRMPIEIDVLRFVSDIITSALNSSKQVLTHSNEVDHE